MYLPDERRACILRLLEERGTLRTASLARELGVTDESIRNDLIALERQGLLQRLHGGARHIVTMKPHLGEGESRLGVLLAQRFISLVSPGATLFLDESPQTMALAAQLSQKECTVASFSPRILSVLSAQACLPRCFSPGGFLDKESRLYGGEYAQRMLLELRPDILVLSPKSFSPQKGCGYAEKFQAQSIRALAESGIPICLLCPASHFYDSSSHVTGSLPIHIVVTEDSLPAETLRYFQNAEAHLELIPSLSPNDLREMMDDF